MSPDLNPTDIPAEWVAKAAQAIADYSDLWEIDGATRGLARAVLAAVADDLRLDGAQDAALILAARQASEPAVDVATADAVKALGFRLDAIAGAHSKAVDAHGGTYGECSECGDEWPCPTYIWAMDPTIEADCAWDAADCAFEGHDHVASILYGTRAREAATDPTEADQ